MAGPADPIRLGGESTATSSRALAFGRVPPHAGWREVVIFGLALLAYQASRGIVAGDAASAAQNAWRIIRLERSIGLDIEPAIQAWTLSVSGAAAALNVVYLGAHLPVTAGFFVWLHRRHPARYPFVRNAFLAANAIALAVFVAHPVAPPRLIQGAGFVDTLRTVSDVDLHGGPLSGLYNPYAAVPSMHLGYALVVGAGVAWLARTPLARLAGALYPVLVLVTITGTANHFVVDAFAGALVVGAGVGVAALVSRITVRNPEAIGVPPGRSQSQRDGVSGDGGLVLTRVFGRG